MKQIPILIDCDPGVDDSFAIALANSHPDFEIVAITAAAGNVPAALTRQNCLCLRELFGMANTKIGFGADAPLKKAYGVCATEVHGENGVGGITFPAPTLPPDPREACDLIYEEAVAHSGELILIATGPLTNIALTLRKHPDLPQHLRRFLIMGGGTFGNVRESGRRAEFNIWIDPTAAKEVFAQLEVYMVGLNATHAAALSPSEMEELQRICASSTAPQTEFLRKLAAFAMENSFRRGHDNNVIHDALAVAAAIDPAVVQFEPYFVYVEDRAVENEGETVIDLERKSGKVPNCHVAMQVDQPRFVKMLCDMCRCYADQ